jgi:hypothetical protein
MPTTSLSFAKIVATPTETSWSQVYNAGSLFAVVSLTSNEETQDDLPTIGKQLFGNLQANIFTLTDKSFASVKQAIETALKETETTVTPSLAIAYIKDTVLYAFAQNEGRITLKRGETIGSILHAEEPGATLVSASGYLETDDTVVLETKEFVHTVTAKTLMAALEYDLPNDIAEIISPQIHGTDEGGASAIILLFKGAALTIPEAEDTPSEEAATEEEPALESTSHETKHEAKEHEADEHATKPDTEGDEPDEIAPQPSFVVHDNTPQGQEDAATPDTAVEEPRQRLSLAKVVLPFRLPANLAQGRNKLILAVALLLIIILAASLFLTRQTKEQKEATALFNQVYPQAQKYYDEGQGLMSLNKELALDDFQTSQQELSKLEGKFKPESSQGKQIAALKTKLDQQLAGESSSASAKASVTQVTADKAPLLKLFLDHSDAIAVTNDENSLYYLTSKAILATNQTGASAETKVTNNSAWSHPVSLGVFSGNFYVLDQSKGLVKFVPTSDGYSATAYFKGEPPDLSEAVSLAIDSSIYILTSDGTISKYTKGSKDSFSLSGLDKKLNHPTMLFTSPDLSSLFVLDNGNSRLLKLSKSGSVQKTYSASIIQSAKAFTVSTDSATAFILSNGKIYQLAL